MIATRTPPDEEEDFSFPLNQLPETKATDSGKLASITDWTVAVLLLAIAIYMISEWGAK